MKTNRIAQNCEAAIMLFALLAASMAMPQPAKGQERRPGQEIIPLIRIDHVPLGDAIRNLARQTGINYIIDPRVTSAWSGADGVRESSVNIRWENVSAGEGLNRLLKENKLALIDNPATSVARIVFTNQSVKPVPASQVGGGTNEIIPLFVMDDVSLAEALRKIAGAAHLNVIFDSKLPVPSTGPKGRTISECQVSLRWQKITARQALAALLDNYDLVLVEGPATSSAKIISRGAL